MVFNLDGGANVSIPVEKTFVPITVQDVYPNGTTITTISSIWSYYLLNSTVVLPDLSNGGHCLTVYAHYQVPTSVNSVGLDTKTIHFTINNGIPPVISNLSIENKTYNQNNLPVNFTVDEPTSWMGYCLDGRDNVTTTENFTLTELPSGSHTLTIYANDTVGNMGTSSTIAFSVAEPFPTVPVAAVASVAAVAVVGAGLLLFWKRRREAGQA